MGALQLLHTPDVEKDADNRWNINIPEAIYDDPSSGKRAWRM
jgi:hypothetical protein